MLLISEDRDLGRERQRQTERENMYSERVDYALALC